MVKTPIYISALSNGGPVLAEWIGGSCVVIASVSYIIDPTMKTWQSLILLLAGLMFIFLGELVKILQKRNPDKHTKIILFTLIIVLIALLAWLVSSFKPRMFS